MALDDEKYAVLQRQRRPGSRINVAPRTSPRPGSERLAEVQERIYSQANNRTGSTRPPRPTPTINQTQRKPGGALTTFLQNRIDQNSPDMRRLFDVASQTVANPQIGQHIGNVSAWLKGQRPTPLPGWGGQVALPAWLQRTPWNALSYIPRGFFNLQQPWERDSGITG